MNLHRFNNNNSSKRCCAGLENVTNQLNYVTQKITLKLLNTFEKLSVNHLLKNYMMFGMVLSMNNKKGKEMKKILKWLLSIFTGKSDEAVDAGICDFSGQGRDKYGR